MNKLIILVALFAMVACVCAQYGGGYGGGYEQPKERTWVSLPALKLKIDLDKLMFKLPNLGSLFEKHQEHEYPQHY